MVAETTEEESRNMTVAEADALNMQSKMMEAAAAPMPTEMREGALMKIEGSLKTVAESHKRLEMLLEELKLMEFESRSVNQIILGVVDMVAETTEEESRNMTVAEADAFKMLSMMAEAAEVIMTMETREIVLKILAETCKNLDMAVGELNLMELEALIKSSWFLWRWLRK